MSLRMRFSATVLTLILASTGTAAANDYAPVPKNAPRVPVAKQVLATNQAAIPSSRILEGSALVIDSEKLKINNIEVRLFGIVPPQLSASYGPQARAAVDRLTQNTTTRCHIRDRANDGRLLATCSTESGTDLALELIRRGLAVTARGSLLKSELSSSYAAAEQDAQARKLGLWSGVTNTQAKTAENAQIQPKTTVADTKPATKDADAQPATEAAQGFGISGSPNGSAKIEPVPESALLPATGKKAEVKDDGSAKATADSIIDANPDAVEIPEVSAADLVPPSVLERYQLLFTGLLMLMTALSVITAVWIQRRSDKNEELRAIAAALRGELMAARAICLSRLRQIATAKSDEKDAISWPRIRAMVFQAHVGRIGWLGAELARQISSIYGLASDYAAYYQSAAADGEKGGAETRQQALQKLVGHIETVLPRLAKIEDKKPGIKTVISAWYRAQLTPPTAPPPGHTLNIQGKPEQLSLTAAVASFGNETPDTFAAATEVTYTKAATDSTEESADKNTAEEEKDAPAENMAADKSKEERSEKASEPVAEKIEETKTGSPAEAEKPEATKDDNDNKTEKEEDIKPEKSDKKPGNKETAAEKAAAQAKQADKSKKLLETATDKLKQVKSFIQDKLTPPAIETIAIDNDEYLAMLNAEAETFAMYELSEFEGSTKKAKKRKTA